MEPWGFPVEDLRMGITAATIGNAAGAKVKPRDFMLGEPDEREDAREFARKLAAALGAPPPAPSAD